MKATEGFGWSFVALERAMRNLTDSSLGHPQERVGIALLWINVVNDAFFQVDKSAYSQARNADPGGRAIPGLVTAFNALKHGSALLVSIRDLTGLPGVRVGPREWVPFEVVRASLNQQPNDEAERSYRQYVEGRVYEEPLLAAHNWIRRAENTWGARLLEAAAKEQSGDT